MDDALAQLIVGLERRLHDPETRRSPDDVAALLDGSFIEFGSSGRVYTKSEIVAELALETKQEFEAFDFDARQLAPGVVLVTYRTQTSDVETVRSSIWVEDDDGWQMVFHQGTRVPPA